MKNFFLAVLLLSCLFISIYSCSKKAPDNHNVAVTSCRNPGAQAQKEAKNETRHYQIHCEGNCKPNEKCALEGVIDGKNTYVQCHCNNCEMVVTLSGSKAGTIIKEETSTLPEGQIEVYFLQAFYDHMATEYPGQRYSMNSIDIWDDKEEQDKYVITYTYELAGGKMATVTFALDITAITSTQKVDCKGTCDCRERYFPSTGAIECTCTNNCSMTITKLAANAWHPLN